MCKKEFVTLTNMCMIYDDNGNVLVQDKVGGNYTGITFPGGHVEKSEPFTDAVIREIFEETGLTISNPQLCGIKDWANDDGTRYMVLLYKTNKFIGELKSSDEGEVYWVNMEKLHNMNLAKGMDKTLQVLCDDDFSEHCFYKTNHEWIEVLK